MTELDRILYFHAPEDDGVTPDIIEAINSALVDLGMILDRTEDEGVCDFGLVSDAHIGASRFVFAPSVKTVVLRWSGQSAHWPHQSIRLDTPDGQLVQHGSGWDEFLSFCRARRRVFAGRRPVGSMSLSELQREVATLRETVDTAEQDLHAATGRIESMDTQIARLVSEAETGLGKRFQDYLDLVHGIDGPPDARFAWAAAEYARERADIAQAKAMSERGKSFGHSVPDTEDGRQFGRIKFVTRDGIYEGETDGVDAHGYGVMTLKVSSAQPQVYRGQFQHGVRVGFGVAEADGCRWQGAFQDEQPGGFGVFTQGLDASTQPPVYQGEYRPAHGEKKAQWLLNSMLKHINLKIG